MNENKKNPDALLPLDYAAEAFERYSERLTSFDEKFSNKFDDLTAIVHVIDKKADLTSQMISSTCLDLKETKIILCKNTDSLVEHMRRTELLENKVDEQEGKLSDVDTRLSDVEKTQIKKIGVKDFLWGTFKIGAAVVGIATLIYTIIQIVQYYKG